MKNFLGSFEINVARRAPKEERTRRGGGVGEMQKVRKREQSLR